ncbi:zinc-dependent metalloprotease family protein [Vibrio penaeicida]|uniref:zinc-dependent metalloprotease family protein n=1 Tax=Vibrio penaeicida TaxID=104609 RepID=UPI00295F06E6|nr:zinc-dependent metalloprotease family protein [Vibrio penaeicida]
MQLIPTTDQLFSLDVNDYYTNNRSDLMQGESQVVIDKVIGQQGYDVGHLFSATGGGSALIGSVCTRGKGSGVSGLGMPMGDAFDIDIVAHEIGHQFGAEHTHNTGCNRVSYNAVEREAVPQSWDTQVSVDRMFSELRCYVP